MTTQHSDLRADALAFGDEDHDTVFSLWGDTWVLWQALYATRGLVSALASNEVLLTNLVEPISTEDLARLVELHHDLANLACRFTDCLTSGLPETGEDD